MEERKTKLTEEELKRYEQALILWERGLKRETEELDAREAELTEREAEVGVFYVPEPTKNAGAITLECLKAAWHDTIIDQPLYSASEKVHKFFLGDNTIKIEPEEFVATIKSCCATCYEGGTHLPDCDRVIYLEIERLANL